MVESAPVWGLELLGPARLLRHGVPVEVGSPQRLALLAVLAMARGHPAGMDTLVDGLWGADPPPRAAAAVRSHVSVLRRLLEPDRAPRSPARIVVTHGSGYSVPPHELALDVGEFRRLVTRAAACRLDDDLPGARAALGAAQRLWRGDALGGLPGPSASLARGLLADERLTALEDLLDAELEADDVAPGRAGVVRRVLAERPHRERLHALLVRVHLAAGRRDEALQAYTRARRALADDLGLEPGPELREARRRVTETPPGADGGTAVAARTAPARPAAPPVSLPRVLAPDALGPPPAVDVPLGRQAVLAEVVALLSAGRSPVHVHGAPGSGVTTVALAAAGTAGNGGEVLVVGPDADPAERRRRLATRPGPGLVVAVGVAGEPYAREVLADVEAARPGARAQVLLAGTHRLPGLAAAGVAVPPLTDDAAEALLMREIGGARRHDDPAALRAAAAMSGGLPRLVVAGARSLRDRAGTSLADWMDAVTLRGPGAERSRARRILDLLLGEHLARLSADELLVLRGVGLHPPMRVPRAAVAATLALRPAAVSACLGSLYDAGLLERGPDGPDRPEEYRALFPVWYHARLVGEADDDPRERSARVDRLLGHYGALLRASLDDRGAGAGGGWEWFDRHEPTMRTLAHVWADRPAAAALQEGLAETAGAP